MKNTLSPRLLTIAKLVSDSEVVADIGTDHAYLPIYLAKANKVKKAYAFDIADEPYAKAKNNISAFNVSHIVEAIQSNGLDYIVANNLLIDSVIISGLGSSTILEILQKDNKNIDCYIISSNTNSEPIREWAKKKKYFIEAEKLVYDNKIIYEVIKINKFAGQKIKSKVDLVFGPILKSSDKNLILQKWTPIEQRIRFLLSGIPKSNPKHKQLKLKLKIISKFLNKEMKVSEVSTD